MTSKRARKGWVKNAVPLAVSKRAVVRAGSFNWQRLVQADDLGETTGTRFVTRRGAMRGI